jgi:hypothetical protein
MLTECWDMLHGRACSGSGNLGRKDAVLVRHGWVCLGAISYVQPPCTVFHSMHPSASCFETFEILALVPALRGLPTRLHLCTLQSHSSQRIAIHNMGCTFPASNLPCVEHYWLHWAAAHTIRLPCVCQWALPGQILRTTTILQFYH